MAAIVIMGAGGFGREVLQWVRDAYSDGAHTVRGFLDDSPDALAGHSVGATVLCGAAAYEPAPGDEVLIAVGNPVARRKLAERLAARGAAFHTLVHPRAYVAPDARLAPGVIVCPFAYVGPEAIVGPHSALNIYASVGHDARLGSFCVLSPYATLNGAAVLEDEVFLGTQAIVTIGRTLGRGAKVAAGSVVYRDVPAHSLAMGNPATSRALPPDAA